jgi:L-ascorbate metabolism protein UlaG (beta-lactamase superfamily)
MQKNESKFMKQPPPRDPSAHNDGKRFYNQYPGIKNRSLRDALHWLAFRKPAKWPKHVPSVQHKNIKKRVEGDELCTVFVNHSTVLLQTQGLNILTDPIWSKRCGPFSLFGPRRVASPGIKLQDLPPIDIVLVSHNHYDHMDLPTLKLLNKAHHPLFIISLNNSPYLKKIGIKNILEMNWWEEKILSPLLKVIFVPAQHFSRRGLLDKNKTLWGGFILEFPKRRVFFAGDTGYGTHFKQIRDKYGPIDLSFLPIGAYNPSWFMSSVHMSPADAVKAHVDLESQQSIGIHFGTFQLSDEPIEAPRIELKAALNKAGIEQSQFRTLNHGEELLLKP